MKKEKETIPLSWKIMGTGVFTGVLFVSYYIGVFIIKPIYIWLGIL
jgi:hypothetical protein